MTTLNTGYTVVGAPVRPLHIEDTFPVLEETQLQGSFRTVVDVASLSTIPAHLRTSGMLAYARAEGAYYQLAPDLIRWMLANFSGGTTAGGAVAATITALQAITTNQPNFISLLGFYAAGDGRGGDFYWNASSTATPVAGMVVQTTEIATGRFIRLYSGPIYVGWLGAKGDNIADDGPPVQTAMDFVGANGGGVVIVPSGYVCDCRTITSFGGLSAVLLAKYDNVELRVETGARLRTSVNAILLFMGGFLKPEGMGNWTAYNVRSSSQSAAKFPLYAINVAAKYAGSVQLVTPADSANFLQDDWIFIRCGQTLTSTDGQPFGEWNKITNVNAGTGVLTLAAKTRNAYSLLNYPVGHPSAGMPAPFGITNCTQPYDVLLHNFRITGKGKLENSSAATTSLISGNQIINRVIDGPELIAYGATMSEGTTLSRHVNTRLKLLGTSAYLAYAQDACNHDSLFADSIIDAVGQATIHYHEACSGQLGNVTVMSKGPVASTNVVSIRAYAHDIHINGLRMVGFGADASSPGIFGDTTTDRITLDSITGMGGVNTNAMAVSLHGTNCEVGTVNTDTGVLIDPGLGNKLRGGLEKYIPASVMNLFGGTPSYALIASNRYYGWLLDDSTTEQVVAFFEVPEEWQTINVQPWFANATTDAGNIRFGGSWRIRDAAGDLNTGTDASTAFTETALTQWIVTKSAGAASLSGVSGKIVEFIIERRGADVLDTKVGDLALLGIKITRTR